MVSLEIKQIIIQIIAFLLMYWILKKYGWQPILALLDARKKKIRAEFDEIAKEHHEAKTLIFEYESKIRNIEREARQKIQEAITEAKASAQEIVKQSQQEAKEQIVKAKEEIIREGQKAQKQLKKEMGAMAIAAAEQLLQKKVDAEEDKRIVDQFLERADFQ